MRYAGKVVERMPVPQPHGETVEATTAILVMEETEDLMHIVSQCNIVRRSRSRDVPVLQILESTDMSDRIIERNVDVPVREKQEKPWSCFLHCVSASTSDSWNRQAEQIGHVPVEVATAIPQEGMLEELPTERAHGAVAQVWQRDGEARLCGDSERRSLGLT